MITCTDPFFIPRLRRLIIIVMKPSRKELALILIPISVSAAPTRGKAASRPSPVPEEQLILTSRLDRDILLNLN